MKYLISAFLGLILSVLTPMAYGQTGVITGTTFYDKNLNGVMESGEVASPLWYLYVDINGNGKQDAGEPSTRSDSNGKFTIPFVQPGTYKVRLASATGWFQTNDATVTVESGKTAVVNLGAVQGKPPVTPAPISVPLPATVPTTAPSTLPITPTTVPVNLAKLIDHPGISKKMLAPATIVTVGPNDDLEAAINAIRTPNTQLTLIGTEYKVKDLLPITIPGTRIVAPNRAIIRHIAGGNNGNMFRILADDCDFEGLDFDSDDIFNKPNGYNPHTRTLVFIVAAKHEIVRNCTFNNIDTGFLLYPGQWDLLIEDVISRWTVRGDFLYCGGADETIERGYVILNRVITEDSQQEHGVRCSTIGFHTLIVLNSSFTCTNHKEPVTLREGSDFYFDNCNFHTDMGVYLGAAHGQTLNHLFDRQFVFHNCTITGGGYYALLMESTDLLVDGGSVEIDCKGANQGLEPCPVLVNRLCKNITVRNLTRICINGTSKKPIVRNYGDATIIEENNTTVNK